MNDEQNIITADNLFLSLENDGDFYADWSARVQNMLPHLFKVTHDRSGRYEVNYSFQFNFLSYSVKECSDAAMSDLVRKHANMQDFGESPVISYDAHKAAAGAFVKKAVDAICSGEITLPADVEAQLATIYAQGEHINVAQATRDLDISRHAVNKLMDTYPADMYRRYRAVQDGKAYALVMGDCAPFINDYPRFSPVESYDEDCHVKLEEGDLVAQFGSDKWYEVSSLTTSSDCIFTKGNGPILHFGFKRLPKRYREQAAKFCLLIHDQNPHAYLSEHPDAA